MRFSDYEHVNFHVDDNVQLNAQWVIIGFQFSEKEYGIIASKSLTHSELRAHITYPDIQVMTEKVTVPEVTFRSSQTLADYVTVTGNSYAECFERLLRNWSPHDDPTLHADFQIQLGE